jgi:ceramide glucosyltransferase
MATKSFAMNTSAIIAIVYLAQLWLKTGLALLHRVRERRPAPMALERVTVIQPVTSGDETLRANLLANVDELHDASLIWVVDRSDDAARDLCRSIKAAHSTRDFQIVETDEPPAGFNPKLWKQIAALPLVHTELLAIIDDDTRASRPSLNLLVSSLDDGADIATGLPCYVPARGRWSHLVAEFVNSAAILTYLPAAACAAPRSINGMCYALRTEYVRQHRLFTETGHAITDDLAIAKEIRRLGGRIVQTTRPQFISTSVTSATHYRRLMHRWFVFTRILVQNESPLTQMSLLLAYGLHPLMLIALFALAAAPSASTIWPLAIVLILRSVTLGLLNRIFTASWRHSPMMSLLAELAQPVFLVGACLHPVIWWRRRKIHVRSFNEFEYLAP